MIKVSYIGKKPSMTDHNYGTGIVWAHKFDVQEVPADKWELLKKHTDVWEEAGPREPLHTDVEYALSEKHSAALRREEAMTAEELDAASMKALTGDNEELPADIEYAMSAEHSYALRQNEARFEEEKPGVTAKAVAAKFAKMTDEEVRAYVKAANGKSLHHKLSGENLRNKALDALKED